MQAQAVIQEQADQMAETLKALAHPMRLRIVAMLCESDQRVINLAHSLSKSQSSVSQQLRILRMSGLVTANKDNGEVRYTIAQPRLADLVECLKGCHS